MKFRKLFLGGAFVLALTASFAFKTNKTFVMTSTYWNTLNQCGFDIVDDDCAIPYTGPQCVGLNTGLPAYSYGDESDCMYLLYHQF